MGATRAASLCVFAIVCCWLAYPRTHASVWAGSVHINHLSLFFSFSTIGKEHIVMNKVAQGKKPYIKPQVVYQAQLEAQAGSPLGDSFDVLNLNGTGK
jgi:hypothetical protein